MICLCPYIQIEASISELAQEGMEARLAAAQTAKDEGQAACEAAAASVEAADRELAGAQAGDGRDESNKSLQERLADANNAQASWQKDWAGVTPGQHCIEDLSVSDRL